MAGLLDNSNPKWDHRNLIAIFFAALIIYMNLKHGNDANALSFLITDCISLFLSLGMITPEQLARLRNGGNEAR